MARSKILILGSIGCGALALIVLLAGTAVAADAERAAATVRQPGGVIVIPVNPCGLAFDDAVAIPIGEEGVVANDQNLNNIPDANEVIRCVTPAQWQGDVVDWNRDIAPRNKIDDTLEQAPWDAALRYDIVVNVRRGVEAADLAEIQALSPGGQVTMVGKYITFVAMRNVSLPEIIQIAGLGHVAFIEQKFGFGPELNNSLAALCMLPAAGGCPNTVQQILPNLDGTGINIVIMDSGVDDIVHQTFRPGQFVAGYNAVTQVFQNPDDDLGHGTHVASIAMGRGAGACPRGMAPNANLIDVRVFGQGIFCNTPGQWDVIVDGLQTTYDNRAAWSVDVINMSFRQCDAFGSVPSNGLDAFSQLVDLAESMGIVTVASAGNSGQTGVMSTPAAATRAITTASADDLNTPGRADDVISGFSTGGPRLNDGDSDVQDELKPEVTAPGSNILAANFNSATGTTILSGTSMSAPHITGLAALLMHARPGINPLSVKNLILAGAEPRGGCSNCPVDPIWNNRWGFGYANAFNSVNQATQTDMSFPNHPSTPPWLSPDIRTATPPRVNIPNTLFATIQNRGPNTALNVRVHFGVHVFSASVPTFFDIGTVIVPSIAANAVLEVGIGWTPQMASHQCAKVELGYGPDTNYTNNIAQRNLFVAMSPVVFQVRNLLSVARQRIDFKTTIPNANGWAVQITPNNVTLGADDCAEDITALPLPPFGTPNGQRKTIHIEAKIGACSLGGVTIDAIMHDCNGNGWDDYEDIRDGRTPDANANGVPDACDPIACQLDLNFNGRVDFNDIEILMSTYGREGIGDVNANGITDNRDLESMASRIGEICHVEHVPDVEVR